MGKGAWRERESREQREKGQRPWKEFLSDFPLRFTQRERERESRHGKDKDMGRNFFTS
jgi:hypothetical protein